MNKRIAFQLAVVALLLFIALRFMTSHNKLSPGQLDDAISGKIGIHTSLSKPNRMYKIIYNLDNTFTMHTMEDCAVVGTTNGHYTIISKYNIGYVDVTYTNVAESPYLESPFNKHNDNNVHKTMKNLLGPFTMHQHANRNAHILEYGHFYGTSNKFMTMFDIQ